MAKYNSKTAAKGALRRAYSRSPMVRAAFDAVRRERPWFKKDGSKAKKPRVEFQCNECKDWFMKKHVQADHIVPVVDPEIGFCDWDTFIERLFVDTRFLQILCKDGCHKLKIKAEMALRKASGSMKRKKV